MNAVIERAGIALRPMQHADLPAVMGVEGAAYRHPWGEGIFRDCLRVGYSCWVMLVGGQVVGHGIMSCAAGECHILNLCIHPRWQGRRLGRRLLRWLLAVAARRNAETAFLEVRGSNRAAIALYASEGFAEVGVRRGYYPRTGGREDAVIMALALLEGN
jgi:ribosomal-protein-alanine N-acetyltransferase